MTFLFCAIVFAAGLGYGYQTLGQKCVIALSIRSYDKPLQSRSPDNDGGCFFATEHHIAAIGQRVGLARRPETVSMSALL